MNPCERVWLALKNRLAWRHFTHLAELQDHPASIAASYVPNLCQSLIAFPYIMDAINALSSS